MSNNKALLGSSRLFVLAILLMSAFLLSLSNVEAFAPRDRIMNIPDVPSGESRVAVNEQDNSSQKGNYCTVHQRYDTPLKTQVNCFGWYSVFVIPLYIASYIVGLVVFMFGYLAQFYLFFGGIDLAQVTFLVFIAYGVLRVIYLIWKFVWSHLKQTPTKAQSKEITNSKKFLKVFGNIIFTIFLLFAASALLMLLLIG